MTEDIFKIDKSEWFKTDKDELIWKDDEVSKFWKSIRKFIKNEESDEIRFTNFHFPRFEYSTIYGNQKSVFEEDTNFWNKGELKEFKKEISFIGCTFWDNTSLDSVRFYKPIKFFNCKFTKGISFSQNIVLDDFIFDHNEIRDNSSFGYTSFYKKTVISFCNFFDYITFQFAQSDKNLLIEYSQFNGKVNFNGFIFYGIFNCRRTSFARNVDFMNVVFERSDFSSVNFKEQVIFVRNYVLKEFSMDSVEFNTEYLSFDKFYSLPNNETDIKIFKVLLFLTRLIEERLRYQDIDIIRNDDDEKFDPLQYLESILNDDRLKHFLNPISHISKQETIILVNAFLNKSFFSNKPNLHFINILFPQKTRFRKFDFANTSFLKSDISNIKFLKCAFRQNHNRIILNDELSESIDFSELETLYRQLKQSFERDKYWDYMDKSYVSEIKMRERQLKNSKDYILLFMYKFYGNFAGYTQDFVRPFLWYSFSTLFFFPIAYYIDYVIRNDYFGLEKMNELSWNIPHYLQLSFSASLPLINTRLIYENWWLKSFQIIFSAVLITFFILAVRRKFRF